VAASIGVEERAISYVEMTMFGASSQSISVVV
jgi:hypothetical protein